jgi:hypothetical protein
VKRWRQVRRFCPSRRTIAFEVASPVYFVLIAVQQQDCLAGRRPDNALLRLCPWERFVAFLFIRHSSRDRDQLLAAFMAQKPAKRDPLSGHRTQVEGLQITFRALPVSKTGGTFALITHPQQRAYESPDERTGRTTESNRASPSEGRGCRSSGRRITKRAPVAVKQRCAEACRKRLRESGGRARVPA